MPEVPSQESMACTGLPVQAKAISRLEGYEARPTAERRDVAPFAALYALLAAGTAWRWAAGNPEYATTRSPSQCTRPGVPAEGSLSDPPCLHQELHSTTTTDIWCKHRCDCALSAAASHCST